MAKTFIAPFAQTPKTATGVATIATSSITGDTPTNTIKLFTAGADGAILTRLWAIPRATVTASSLLLFISNDSGTTKRLIDSVLMSAQTISTTIAILSTKFSNYSETTPLRIAAGDEIYVGTQIECTDGIVFYTEYTEF